jgi:PTH1 family peptidyl-tRNA hydrolase
VALFGRARDERPERRGTPADLLVVGLGNPGADYAGTRHNTGSEVVELLAQRHGGQLRKARERARTCEVTVGVGEALRRLALAVPLTFYNEAGLAVAALARRHGIDEVGRIVVVHDELDLPPGRIKVKLGGGLAGNNGLKSTKSHLGTDAFARVRIGVGKPPGRMSGADHVLRRPGKAERAELDIAVVEAADAVEAILTQGLDAAMNRYNTRAGDAET